VIRTSVGVPRGIDVQSGAPARHWRPRLAFVLALLVVAVLSLLYVRQTGDLAATGYDVANLQRETVDWQRRNDQLRVDAAQLEAVDRVGRAASQRLGMGPPHQIVFVRSTPIRVPALATPVATTASDPESPILSEARQWLGLP
jgi:hypothetical protein